MVSPSVGIQLIPFEEMDAVTKYLLAPRWGVPAYSLAFPITVTEQLIGAHLKCVICALPRISLTLTLDGCSTVIKSYRLDDELGVLTIIDSVRPTAESPKVAFGQTLLIIVLETLMRNSQVSK